ncbi:hypothetical protein [Microbacterium trichothecenolyticum]|uniref:Uncharacterized protein n=1 Tax=Microbacterium trichothecenolyticum TaxID=69370 RepID=A0A0M2HDV2_MICTR|nr:hypothetical protein [Microbacterium trichothecenolyticum]KJL42362.1 hypothetical protein RS82_02378 [Microbacterium trichothecenolyticum]
MMATQGSGRRSMLGAIVGGAVLVAAIVAIVVSSLLAQQPPSQTATPDETEPAGGTASVTATPEGAVVDPDAAQQGWTPEPITTDPEVYIRAALETASTFDTQASSREEWLAYLDTWFTPDTRYNDPVDQDAALRASRTEMRQGVVLPAEEWESLAREDGRVVATTGGAVTFVPVSQDPSGDMLIGTADVTLTFTRSDGSGGETSYEEQVRVSVQVLCGPGSVPTPDTAQLAGDCKVVRYFTEPMEP